MLGSVIMEMLQDKPDPSEEWFEMAMIKDAPKHEPQGMASDDDMRIMQESFDAVTRVTSAIRKVDG